MATVKQKKPIKKIPAASHRSPRPVGRGKKPSKKALLIHHRHSFKLVHHRHTSYPLLAFMLLLTAIFSVGWTAFARGDSYSVNAVVPAALLPTAATIASPHDGTVFKSPTMTISGDCPQNSYIKLFRNTVFAGAALCQSDGSWSIQIQLTSGTNLLNAQDYNVTNQAGPNSNDVTVTYQPPVTTVSSSVSTPANEANQVKAASKAAQLSPLLISTGLTYNAYFTNQLSNWPLTIGGGTAPYAVQIDWGDGETNLKSLGEAGLFDLQHAYQQPGGYKNSYLIKIVATDATGQTTLLQLFTLISPVIGTAPSQSDGTGPTTIGRAIDQVTGSSAFGTFWRAAAPALGVSAVAVSGFWLGELREGARFAGPRIRWQGHNRFRP